MERRAFLVTLVGAATSARAPVAAPVTIDEIGDRVQTLPRGQWPEFAAEPSVQAAYRFAVEHDDLAYIPCFCGCARLGHTSNRDCYVKAFNRDGTITFTSHAAT